MNKFLLTLFLFSFLFAKAEKTDGQDILAEAKLMYRLEKAAWTSTDIIIEKFNILNENIGGYVSYSDDKNHVFTTYYDKSEEKKLLIRFEFDSLPSNTKFKYEIDNLNKTEVEHKLIKIRTNVYNEMMSKDKFFTYYENTSFNIVIIPKENKIKAYVLTASKSENEVLLGNDYLLIYNNNYELDSKKQLHLSLIRNPFSFVKDGNKLESTMHTHVITEFITPTEICTLLLYKDKIEWKELSVFSKDYASVFNIQKESLEILTFDEFKLQYDNKKKEKLQNH